MTDVLGYLARAACAATGTTFQEQVQPGYAEHDYVQGLACLHPSKLWQACKLPKAAFVAQQDLDERGLPLRRNSALHQALRHVVQGAQLVLTDGGCEHLLQDVA